MKNNFIYVSSNFYTILRPRDFTRGGVERDKYYAMRKELLKTFFSANFLNLFLGEAYVRGVEIRTQKRVSYHRKSSSNLAEILSYLLKLNNFILRRGEKKSFEILLDLMLPKQIKTNIIKNTAGHENIKRELEVFFALYQPYQNFLLIFNNRILSLNLNHNINDCISKLPETTPQCDKTSELVFGGSIEALSYFRGINIHGKPKAKA